MKIFAPHATDFYKTGHIFQYPKGTTFVYSNMTPRSDRWATVLSDFDHKVVNFGALGVCKWLLRDLWNDSFFNKPKEEVVKKYKRRMDNALGRGAVTVDHIAALHDLGYLPISFLEIPEGARVDIRVPLWIMYNTLPEFFWVTNYLETQLSAELWKPLTTATIAREFRRLLDHYAEKTGAAADFVPFQGHGFEARGMSGIYDSASNAAAHLLSLSGTDTILGIDYLEDYYNADSDKELIGGSVPATEHSVECTNIILIVNHLKKAYSGLTEDEYLYQAEVLSTKRLITEVYPSGIVSKVSDTYDFWAVITKISAELKDIIMSRDGKVVFRPDSGDPVKIICGDPLAEPGSPAFKGAVQCLWEIFGGTVTSKGFKTLDSHVGTIYGDSISLERAQAILEGLARKGFSSGNIVFGVGSFTYQYVTRDTFGTAIKATYAIVNGETLNLYKDPKTDNGIKKSAKGLLKVTLENGHYVLHNEQLDLLDVGEFVEIFRDSKITHEFTFAEIKERLANS